MGKIIWYEHHGQTVAVDEDLKGKHRNHCLCFRCRLFRPNRPKNCVIARRNYELCQQWNLVTPVYECPGFDEGEPDFSGMG